MIKILIFFLTMMTLKAFASDSLATVDHVDLQQYSGKWYVITSLPKFFTQNCVAQTALYTIKDNSSLTILNTCIKADSSSSSIEGVASILNSQTNAELEVFFDNFWTKLFRIKGDYTIIKLEADYSVALVGSKNRKGLWLLSRTSSIKNEIREKYVGLASTLGYQVSTLVDSKF